MANNQRVQRECGSQSGSSLCTDSEAVGHHGPEAGPGGPIDGGRQPQPAVGGARHGRERATISQGRYRIRS